MRENFTTKDKPKVSCLVWPLKGDWFCSNDLLYFITMETKYTWFWLVFHNEDVGRLLCAV